MCLDSTSNDFCFAFFFHLRLHLRDLRFLPCASSTAAAAAAAAFWGDFHSAAAAATWALSSSSWMIEVSSIESDPPNILPATDSRLLGVCLELLV